MKSSKDEPPMVPNLIRLQELNRDRIHELEFDIQGRLQG